MKTMKNSWLSLIKYSSFLLLLLVTLSARCQENMFVNLSRLDGIDITPDNIFNFEIINNVGISKDVTIKGILSYKQSRLNFSYSFKTQLVIGKNSFSKDKVINPVWQFSDPALRELFFNYKKLPQGNYEYCVSVQIVGGGDQNQNEAGSDCIYQKADDIFLINLVSPDDNAKIYEHNPMLSWIVNYPFASELIYRVRLTDLKKGQNNISAITRNLPIYQDEHVLSTNIVYPVSAKPLEVFQPYVWTVDAYYKGILLGGAEVWKFTIIDDSVMNGIPRETSFIDFTKEEGKKPFYAIGNIKLKYVLEDTEDDLLSLKLQNSEGQTIKLPIEQLKCTYGDNRFVIDLRDKPAYKHLATYHLTITTQKGKQYQLVFKYVNPDFFK